MERDFSLELPNDVREIEEAVEVVVDRSLAAGFDDDDRLRLNLRVSLAEALANAMLNGNRKDPGKRVRVHARLGPRRIVISVTDEGGGFDPENLPDPTLPEHRANGRGRGIFLIRHLMDAVEFNDRGNSITMVLEHSASDADDTPTEARSA